VGQAVSPAAENQTLEASMQAPQKGSRKVKRIVITYVEGGQEYDYTLTHEGGQGADVNALVWDSDLMDKLRYAEPSKPNDCEKPKRSEGKDWKGKVTKKPTGKGEAGMTAAASGAGEGQGDCVYIHKTSCEWGQICDWT
jgi:hypothetical protein